MLKSTLGMIRAGAKQLGVATDHVIESFRNKLWPGYKTGEGLEADLWSQFSLLEDVLTAAGYCRVAYGGGGSRRCSCERSSSGNS